MELASIDAYALTPLFPRLPDSRIAPSTCSLSDLYRVSHRIGPSNPIFSGKGQEATKAFTPPPYPGRQSRSRPVLPSLLNTTKYH